MKTESENLQSEISKKNNLPENENIEQTQHKTIVAGNTPDMIQSNQTKNNDLEVKGQVETPVKINQQSTISNSVLNYEHKDAIPIESQQLSTNEENNIIIPTKVNNSNITIPTKVNNSSKVKQPNNSELIIKGTFNYFQLITR